MEKNVSIRVALRSRVFKAILESILTQVRGIIFIGLLRTFFWSVLEFNRVIRGLGLDFVFIYQFSRAAENREKNYKNEF